MAIKQTLSRRQQSRRAKISTTVAAETYAYLQSMVSAGEAQNLSGALDDLVRRRLEDQRRADLDRRMAEYYDAMTDSEIAETRLWGELSEAEMSGSDRA